MKTNNNLIKVTNERTGEYRYFTKDSYVMVWSGASLSAMPQIRGNCSLKYNYLKYEIVDGSNIIWSDIDKI